MRRVLVTIEGNGFAASLILGRDGEVSETAPILRWCKGEPWPKLYDLCRRRGWRVWLEHDPADPVDPEELSE